MDELLQTIADRKGYPSDLVERAAQARAKASGVSTEAILRSWAGVGDAPVAAPSDAVPTPEPAAPEAAAPAVSEPSGPKVEVLAPEEPASEGSDDAAEVASVPEPEPAAAGALVGFPRWLAVAFVVLPALALLYVLVLPSGPSCGSAGALAIDPSTGVAENCDGSEYGSDANDVFAIGASIYDSIGCAGCHGANGGGGVGPAFTNGAVLSTFSTCSDHIEWVSIGSSAWPELTYGDNATTVSGGMPGYLGNLSIEDIAAVVLYERVAFGGEERAAAETACVIDAEVAAAP